MARGKTGNVALKTLKGAPI